MAISEGSSTYYAYKKESSPNTEETGSGGAILRRVDGQLDLEKAEVTSAEKRTDFQEANVTHGTRSVSWRVNGELYGGDYKELLAAICRRDFSAISSIDAGVGEEFTIASGVLSRAGGSFVTDGALVGLVGRLSAMTVTGNNSRNLLLTSVAATDVGITAIDGGAAVADDATADSNASLSIPGMVTYIPESGHTSDTFTIERYDSKTDTSQVGWGCKVGTVEISIQPDQAPTISFAGLGIDRREYTAGSAPSLTSPTAAGTGALMAAAIGYIRLNGTAYAVVTSANLVIDTGISNQPVVGANVSPDVFYGRAVQVTGTLNILRQGVVVENLFDDETECELNLIVNAPGSEPRAFYNFFMPRVKLTSAPANDPDGPSSITANFRAIKKATATGYAPTTLLIQDSSAA